MTRCRRLVRALLSLGALAFLIGGWCAGQGTRVPVQVVAGRLVVRCDVSTRFRRLPVNLFLDYEATCGLQLHNKAAAGLKAEREDGTAFPITVHLPDLKLTVERRELGDDEALDEFTRWNSIDLGEVAVVGTIGARLLSDQHVLFDLDAGYVELSPAREREEEEPEKVDGITRLPVSIIDDIVWLPVIRGDGIPAAMALGTGVFDTTVDSFLAEDLGHPAGDIGAVKMGGIELTEYVALRPAEVNYVHPDGALGVTGLNLLQHFRVEVDRVNRAVTIEEARPADYPEGDLDFFTAMVDEDRDALIGFLGDFPEHRLALEAARLLVTLQLIEGVGAEEMRAALEWVDRASPEDLRATSALEQMKTCSAFGCPEHLILAGSLGIESGRDDRYPEAVHQIHARMGEVQLELGDETEAWRHLLSAAFGIPEDGMVNLNLGRFYEGQRRFKRAFSRYVQASIRPDSGPRAVEGLARIADRIPEGERFSVDLVERMIAGKVRNFGAATHFVADAENSGNRVVLVELFTSGFLGDEREGAIGGALAQEGLIGHFPPENVAFLSYHLPKPQPDPLINELGEATARLLGVRDPWIFVVDGVKRLVGAGKWSDAEALYSDVRKQVLTRLLRPSDFELELHFTVKGDTLRGELVARGPDENRNQVHLVLAEKGVLFPGSTGVVVHRMLARAELTGKAEGIPFYPILGEMTVPFELSLDGIRERNEQYLDEFCAGGGGIVRKLSMSIDPGQARVVAIIRDSLTGRVSQAICVEPENLAELEGEGR
jgi:hypothetical protein